MKPPFSIQRIKEVEGKLTLDFMGVYVIHESTVKKSLNQIVDRRHDYVVAETSTQDEEGNTLYLLLPVDLDEDEYCKFLEELATDEYRTKAPTGFKSKLNSSLYKDYYTKTVAWWDLDNHVIFCFGEGRMTDIINQIEERLNEAF